MTDQQKVRSASDLRRSPDGWAAAVGRTAVAIHVVVHGAIGCALLPSLRAAQM